MIKTKSIYESADTEDGYRVLVDRLWPRGLTRERARIDEWLRDAGSSDGLRKRFHEHPERWDEFKEAYLEELKTKDALLGKLASRSKAARVTLLFSYHDPEHNQAVVLKEFLDRTSRSKRRSM